MRIRFLTLLALGLLALAAAVPAAAFAALGAPWNGEPLSQGLGPTYGETWPVSVPSNEAVSALQGDPLALIPYADIQPMLEQFKAEAATAGAAPRMTYWVSGKSAAGRDMYAVVINDLETANQKRDYARWRTLRNMELTNPAQAQTLLANWRGNVKMPIYIEAAINGTEYEGVDAVMQAIRDLTTTPYGQNETIDKFLDHAILILNPTQNPDGRVMGIRGNAAVYDTNRDNFLQSQPEEQNSIRLQHEWVETAGLDMHGYYTPTLIDGLTIPHNPAFQYDIFGKWNQLRTAQNKTDFNAMGLEIQRPVNDWGAGPDDAQGWDDWGPFYGQTYMAFMAVDSSTVEMARAPNGRLTSKTAQYMAFYSSVNYWLDNRQAMMHDQLEVFRRGVANEQPSPTAIADSAVLSGLGFTDAINNWMTTYPEAYVIPFGAHQRSDAEANRLVLWLLDNGIQVDYAKQDFTWNGTSYQAGTYVVSMSQAFRGLAWDALSAGTDIENRISELYASPAAWSHGLLWGADTLEVPLGDASFTPKTKPVATPNPLVGGIRGGVKAKADFYSVTLKGVHEDQAILGLLREGLTGEIAEASFTSTTGGETPAGTLIFPADQATALKLDAAGKAAGMWIERNVGVAKPQTTKVDEAPKVAILATGIPTRTVDGTTYFTGADTDGVLKILFGDDAQYVSTTALQNDASDPLAGFDVIYNAGASYPSATNTIARARLADFFARGAGYIATNVSTRNFSFLSDAGLVNGSLTQGSQDAYGGIAIWSNVGGVESPISGAYPSQDYMFLPSNTTYFTGTPTGAIVDGQYLPNFATIGPENGYVAGMWLNRDSAANNATVLIHGDTTSNSRYVAYATNPFSRYDAEREWPLIVQAALWSDLTDE